MKSEVVLKIGSFLKLLILAMMLIPVEGWAQESGGEIEEKLYNFDDMLIDGAFRDPQGMFERARSEAKFEGVLRLERSFMNELEKNAQESSMRP